MKAVKKAAGILLVLCFVLQLLPVASASASPVYLALGDSISTGYGLQEGVPGFVDQVAKRFDALTLVNGSINGNTAAGIYAQLQTGELDDELAAAELITLTCGGNDLMAVLYVKLANLYNADHPDAPIQPTDVTDIFGGTHPALKTDDLMGYALTALEGLAASAEFEVGLADYAETLGRVLQYIREKSPEARVLIPTQYNPYNTFQKFLGYRDVYEEIEAGVLLLNEVIRQQAAVAGCLVADVYQTFADSESDLCNAKAHYLDPPEMDFHPNAAGHTVMAAVILHRLFRAPAAIESVAMEDGTVELALELTEELTLAAAFYDPNGRLTGVELQPVTPAETHCVLQAELTGEAAKLQVFLLDSRSLPLYPALQWSAS